MSDFETRLKVLEDARDAHDREMALLRKEQASQREELASLREKIKKLDAKIEIVRQATVERRRRVPRGA